MTELENTAQSQHDVGYERKLVLLFALGWGFLFLDRLCISYLMPTLMPALELNNAQVGYIGSITTVCFAISSAVVGALSDRSGYRKNGLFLLFSQQLFYRLPPL